MTVSPREGVEPPDPSSVATRIPAVTPAPAIAIIRMCFAGEEPFRFREWRRRDLLPSLCCPGRFTLSRFDLCCEIAGQLPKSYAGEFDAPVGVGFLCRDGGSAAEMPADAEGGKDGGNERTLNGFARAIRHAHANIGRTTRSRRNDRLSPLRTLICSASFGAGIQTVRAEAAYYYDVE